MSEIEECPFDVEEAELNKGQQAAAEGFMEFLVDPDESELIISGGGGVGKTFLMGHLIDKIIPDYFNTCKLMDMAPEFDSVDMTATTNKAAAVLGEATKRPTETIYSYMNLVVKNDYSTGRSQVRPSRSWKVHEKNVIFIDECSFIDSTLDKFINQGTHDCKIVYVGDHCQLAPVMETISPIYNRGIPFFELTEPMRTGCPHLQALNTQLRETVETGEFKPIKIVPGIIDWIDDQQLQAELGQKFLQPNQNDRILAYTNNRVLDFNDYVQDIRGRSETYVAGDVMVNNAAIKIGNIMIGVEQELIIESVSPLIEEISLNLQGLTMKVQGISLKTMYGTKLPTVQVPVDKLYFQDLLKYAAKSKDWTLLFMLKDTFPDLRQREASTVYKAQGSSYNTVYVDVGDLSKVKKPDEAARMLYVAGSRARKRVAFYGDLTSKYGGLIR